jgi:hypothetical protein
MMLNTIATAIEDRLKALSLFKSVGMSFTGKTMGLLPAAVFYLTADKKGTDRPSVSRDLVWEVDILVSQVAADQGQTKAMICIDAVREAFSDWQAFPSGCLATSVPEISIVGVEDTLLIYSAKIEMRVFPERF